MKRFLTAVLALALTLLLAVPAMAAAPGARAIVDGAEIQAVLDGGKAYAPAGALAEKLGFTFAWDAGEQKITLTKGAHKIELWVGSTRAKVDGTETQMDAPARMSDGQAIVPLRFVAESAGAYVGWDSSKQAAVVTTPHGMLMRIQKNQAVMPDMKGHAEFQLQMHGQSAADPSDRLTIAMPMTMDIHSYKGDMLIDMSIQLPSEMTKGLPMPALNMSVAAKDKKLYVKDPVTGKWTLTGEYDPANITSLSQSLGNLPGGIDFLRLEEEFLSRAVVTPMGKGQVDGVTLYGYHVDLSAVDIQSMFDKVLATMGMPDLGASFQMNVERFSAFYWINPETGFPYTSSVEMQYDVVIDAGQDSGSLQFKVNGFMEARPTSDPISFPAGMQDGTSAAPREVAEYWSWLKGQQASLLACRPAEAEIVKALDRKDYAGGKAAAEKASACYAATAKVFDEKQAPEAFAGVHQGLLDALAGKHRAFVLLAEGFAAGADGVPKVTEANKLNQAAENQAAQAAAELIRLQAEFGLH